MKLKVSKKLAELNFSSKQILKVSDGAKIKGGGMVWCCARNKWVEVG